MQQSLAYILRRPLSQNLKSKACVPPNDFLTDKKIGRLCLTKKIGRFYHRFFFKFSVSFVCENRWKHTDLGVTPKDLPTDKNTKIGGCLYICQYHYIYIGVQIIKYKIFQIENLTTFFTSGGKRAQIYTISGKCVCWILQYNNCGKNLCKFIEDFLLDHYFHNKIEGVPVTRGHTPYLILG